MKKTLKEFMVENSLYSNDTERNEILTDKAKVAKIFMTSFIGTLAIFGSNPKGTSITRYLTKEKFVRLQAIGDENNDLTIAIKLALDAKLIRRAEATEMTKLAFLLRSKKIDSLDESALRDLITATKTLYNALDGRWRTAFGEYMAGKVNVYQMMAKLREPIKQADDIGQEFKALYHRNRIFLNKKAGVVAVDPADSISTQADSQDTPVQDAISDQPTAVAPANPVDAMDLTIPSNVQRHLVAALKSGDGKAYFKSIGVGVSTFPWNILEINDEVAIEWFLNDRAGIPGVYMDRVPMAFADQTSRANFHKKVQFLGMTKAFTRFDSIEKYLDSVRKFLVNEYDKGIKPPFSFDFLLESELTEYFSGKANSLHVALRIIEFFQEQGVKSHSNGLVLTTILGQDWISGLVGQMSSMDSDHQLAAFKFAVTRALRGATNSMDSSSVQSAVDEYSKLNDVSLLNKEFVTFYDELEAADWLDNDTLKKFRFDPVTGIDTTIYEKYVEENSIPDPAEAIEFMEYVVAHDKFEDFLKRNTFYRETLSATLVDALGVEDSYYPGIQGEFTLVRNYGVSSGDPTFTKFFNGLVRLTYKNILIQKKDLLFDEPKFGIFLKIHNQMASNSREHGFSRKALYEEVLSELGINKPVIAISINESAWTAAIKEVKEYYSDGFVLANPSASELIELYSKKSDSGTDFHGEITSRPMAVPANMMQNPGKKILRTLLREIEIDFKFPEIASEIVDGILTSYSVEDIKNLDWASANSNFTNTLAELGSHATVKSFPQLRAFAEHFKIEMDSRPSLYWGTQSSQTETAVSTILIKTGESFIDTINRLQSNSDMDTSVISSVVRDIARELVRTDKDLARKELQEVFIKMPSEISGGLMWAGATAYERDLQELTVELVPGVLGNSDVDSKHKAEIREMLTERCERSLTSRYGNLNIRAVDLAVTDPDLSVMVAKKIQENLSGSNDAFKGLSKDYSKNGENLASTLIRLDKDVAIELAETLSGVSQRQLVEGVVQNEFMTKVKVREGLYSASAAIKPQMELADDRINKILQYNSVNIMPSLPRKKKGVTLAERIQEAVDTLGEELKEMPVAQEDLSQDGLDRRSVEYAKFNTGRHGDTALRFLKSFDVGSDWTDSSYEKFKEKHSDTVMYPMFHGTGSVAASMILRYGFAIIDSNDPSAVGRLLGNGIYFSNAIDKVAQYIGDDGYARKKGMMGYIFEMEAVTGSTPRNYKAAGLGGDNIRSPEWAVYDPKAQLSIKKAHEVMLVSKDEIDDLKKKVIGESYATPLRSFAEWSESVQKDLMVEAKMDASDMPYVATFIFKDSTLPQVDGSTIPWEEFESPNHMVFLDSSRYGPSLVITYKDPDLFDDSVYMVDDTKDWMNSGDSTAAAVYSVLKKKRK